MKSLKSLLIAALALVSTSAMAQSAEPEYQFKKHAFITLQGGAQYTLGEAKFKDLLSPNAQLSLGYQFSPVFAARIQANGWQSKGGWANYRDAKLGTPFNKDYKFNYVAPGLDLMFNLSNLFCGYNPKRFFNLTLFLGGGANIAFKNDEANDIAKQLYSLDAYNLQNIWDGTKVRPFGRGGLEFAFRLSDAVKLVLEGNANILNDKYNSKWGDNPDWYFNALAGLRINLGKAYTKVEPFIEPVEEPVQQNTYVAPVQPKPEPPKPPVKIEPLRRDVFFTINSTKIVETEEAKVREIVDYLNKYPKAKVSVTGYADAGTGNDQINDRLAAGRADAVANMLTQKYNIPADRIMKDSKGSRVQPFAENDLNRVSICIAE
ncbi:MAG: OmpA family protein [Prevotella sp.]|nr:OmpA family protein [Prevotella sp.]